MYSNMEFVVNYSKEYSIVENPDCCGLLQEVNLRNFTSVLEISLANIYNYKHNFLNKFKYFPSWQS